MSLFLNQMLIAFNKPYGTICQFSSHEKYPTLKNWIDIPHVYPAGRLDTDSEGLLLLTDDGLLQQRIASARLKQPKIYWAQVEGDVCDDDLIALRTPLDLGDFVTRPARAKTMESPDLWIRNPPIRVRKSVPDSWIQITLTEGKNRQVRRMCAKIGFPCLRLVRVQIADVTLGDLQPGEWKEIAVPSVWRKRQSVD